MDIGVKYGEAYSEAEKITESSSTSYIKRHEEEER